MPGVATRAASRSAGLPSRTLRPTTDGSRRPTREEVHAFGNGRERTSIRDRGPVSRVRIPPNDRDTMNLPLRPFGFLRFTPERFHVLLNSLFKVLFNFPSRYLFAIGLVVIFSLRWSLPPSLGCTLKQPDSEERPSRGRSLSLRAWHPLWVNGPVQEGLGRATRSRDDGPSQTPHFTATGEAAGIRRWALPCSLAATGGILVSFFSSA